MPYRVVHFGTGFSGIHALRGIINHPELELEEDQAPDWPRGLAGGFNITAMRAVNAIPALCRAAPGVVSTFDLEPVTGRGRFARSAV